MRRIGHEHSDRAKHNVDHGLLRRRPLIEIPLDHPERTGQIKGRLRAWFDVGGDRSPILTGGDHLGDAINHRRGVLATRSCSEGPASV